MKKNLFLLSGILVLSFSSQAQELKEDYMTWPESSKLGQYVSSWVLGEDLFEDENFYVSRVKPKERFRNAATQIDETLTEANDRKLVFWVPVGNASNGNTNARPNGKFDSEALVLGHTLLITETGRLHSGGSPVDSPMSPIKMV